MFLQQEDNITFLASSFNLSFSLASAFSISYKNHKKINYYIHAHVHSTNTNFKMNVTFQHFKCPMLLKIINNFWNHNNLSWFKLLYASFMYSDLHWSMWIWNFLTYTVVC